MQLDIKQLRRRMEAACIRDRGVRPVTVDEERAIARVSSPPQRGRAFYPPEMIGRLISERRRELEGGA